jgi:hypothetical protein
VLNKRHETRLRPIRQRPTGWLLGFILGSHALAAQAETPCDVQPTGQTIHATLTKLRSLEPQCHKNAPFLYAFGQLLNQVGQYEEAIDPLEGALMYRPDHWPTQLEYAIALEGVGDHDSARALIQGLTQNIEVDTATKQQLTALQLRPEPSAPDGRRGRLNLVTGYDNNLLNSTYHTQFTLTTPDGGLPVQLDEGQRPRAGRFVRAETSYDGLLAASATAQWRYSVVGSYRSNPDYSPANLGQFGVFLERSTPSEPGPYVAGQHQMLWRAGALTLRQTQLGLGYDFSNATNNNCQQRVGLDRQHLTYPVSTALGGNYTGIVGTINCPQWGLLVQVRAGKDQPFEDNRPGGAQQQTSLRVSKRTPVHAGALALEWEATHQQDQRGYSPLLANDAQRYINRSVYRLEYRWQAGALTPYIGLEWANQRSNLTLFEFKNRLATFGFRTRW